MSVEPLFVADMTTLKSSLRLSGAVQIDALAQIDEAVQQVRAGFYDALNAARIVEIKDTATVLNPTTAAGILRMKANSTEVKWVRMLLMRMMPLMFMEAAPSTNQTWNEEGLTREVSSTSLDREISRLQTEINDALEDLGGAEPDYGTANVTVIEPECTPPRPFDSIRLRRYG